jgi:phage shock protein C
MLGGVCGGLGSYLGVDPTLVRIVTVLSLFLPGPQILAYLVAWIIVPEEPYVAPAPAAPPPRSATHGEAGDVDPRPHPDPVGSGSPNTSRGPRGGTHRSRPPLARRGW